MTHPFSPTGPRWANQTYHRHWLLGQARALLDSFAVTINPKGGFFALDEAGRPITSGPGADLNQLQATARMVYCYALGHLLGHPGSSAIVDHGMECLWRMHRDAIHGGYYWRVGDSGPDDPSKQAYGHAFVLLAGAAAKTVGHPDAGRLIEDVTTVLLDRFWEIKVGATSEEYTADWRPLGAPYRGQNSNMHLTEALMAAFEATGDRRYIDMAVSIAELIIHRVAAANGWRVIEHFSGNWDVERDYAGSEIFRPAGTTPGHWLEWSRLLVQLCIAAGQKDAWMPVAAAALFRNAVGKGWDNERGGLYYTLDWSDRPLRTDKIWWPLCEGIGAAVFLGGNSRDGEFFEAWYRRIWDFVSRFVIDRATGRWIPQLDAGNRVATSLFTGRPDIYHALQACLIPLLPAEGSLLKELSAAV